jgi:predicted protein tyrosine phosphatase
VQQALQLERVCWSRVMGASSRAVPVIDIVPRVRVSEMLLSESQGSSIGCVVSIGDPGQRRPSGLERVARRLRLEFHDVLENSEFDTAPCTADVERLIRFAEASASTELRVLVHCEAGISRSTAAALILYAVWLGPGSEEDAAARVFSTVPYARPNRTMVRIADDLLQRQGALLAAVERRLVVGGEHEGSSQ